MNCEVLKGGGPAMLRLQAAAMAVGAIAALSGCTSTPDPRSSNEAERADALMQSLEDLGYKPTREAATRNARTFCTQIDSGIRTRDEVVDFWSTTGDIDGDVWMDAAALYACPQHYTE
ncbi:hypothetical protein GCM10023328_47620 [Modestobacter marinus]|uniref:DUF732 domain-containing protein n=1 Tax=Modestobacter marinus TaxID=477641 RepID=A0A846LRZ9_9ACTN|nr:hypothetical protein [Modestobacter marinus]NIH70261.1 hypothetical protein [Modestobacter marinus]GGL85626.1 hypothetical protein GCM10011589_47550 [Modestobacter marinus]